MTSRRGGNAVIAMTVVLLAALASGCSSEEDVSEGYGRRRGYRYHDSVNGTAVLAGMFEQAGCRVGSWSALSPRIEQADVIVWFPDRHKPPSPDVVERLNQWLEDEPQRTLVYVGRDYDAAIDYWAHVRPNAPAGDALEYDFRKGNAEQRLADRLQDSGNCVWFSVSPPGSANHPGGRLPPPQRLKRIAGPWVDDDLDQTLTQLQSRCDFQPGLGLDPLLEGLGLAGQPFVLQKQRLGWGHNKLIVVQNGSFLLNYALVNHEHRKLAGRLIDETLDVSGPAATVLFLESGEEDPPILDHDPHHALPTGPFAAPPTIYIWQHGVALAVLVVFAAWPIFGRAKRLDPPPAADFARHIEAVGALLEKSGDRGYCKSRVDQYRLSRGEGSRGEGSRK